MRAFISSLVVLVVITIGAAYIIGAMDHSASTEFSSNSTRY